MQVSKAKVAQKIYLNKKLGGIGFWTPQSSIIDIFGHDLLTKFSEPTTGFYR